MADLLDTFTGSAGLLSAHTADSGDTWLGAESAQCHLDGSGSLYASTFIDLGHIPYSSWTPASANYAVSVTMGADWITGAGAGGDMGPCARVQGTDGALSYYVPVIRGQSPGVSAGTPTLLGIYRIVSGDAGSLVGAANISLGAVAAAGDTWTLSAVGSGAAVTLTFALNGALIYQTTDTSGARLIGAGTAGLYPADASGPTFPAMFRRISTAPTVDLLDTFTESAGLLTGTVSDSGHTWGPTGDNVAALDGTGYAYANGNHVSSWWSYLQYTDWTQASADYSCKVTLGADAGGAFAGPAVRLTGTNGSVEGYVVGAVGSVLYLFNVHGGVTVALINAAAISPPLATGDVLELQVTGSNPVLLTVLRNGGAIGSASDSSINRIPGNDSRGAGSAGFLAGTVDLTSTPRVIDRIQAGPITGIRATDTFDFGGVAHSPGQLILTKAWTSAGSPGTAVTFTPTCAQGTFTPSTIVWTGSAWSNDSATLAINGSVSPGAYDVTVTATGGIATSVAPFSIIVPTAQVLTGSVAPHGNVIAWFPAAVSDSSPQPGIAASLVGATLTVNGGSPIPMDAMIPAFTGASGDPYCWTFAGQHEADRVILPGGAGYSHTGTAASTTTQQSNPYQNFSLNFDGTGTISYFTDVAATSIYSFTGLTPGATYSLYRPWHDHFTQFAANATSVGGTPTTHAQDHVTDGTTSTDHADDQTTNGSFDEVRYLYRLTKIATVTPVGSTLTVTRSNAAGADTRYDNGLVLIFEPPARTFQPTDVVLMSLRDNAVTTPVGTIGPTTITLTMETAATWSGFNPTLPRNMSIGYNLSYLENAMNSTYANKTKNALDGGWDGGTLDGVTGQLAAIGTSQSVKINRLQRQYFGASNTQDTWGLPGSDGDWTARFTVPTGGHPTLNFRRLENQAQVANSNYGAGGNGQAGDGGLGGNTPITFTQPVGHGPFPYYAQSVTLDCTSEGATNDIVQNLWVGDGMTDPAWTRMIHPAAYDRFHGRFDDGYLRWIIQFGILQSQLAHWTDQHSIDEVNYLHNSCGRTVVVASIEPLTGADATLASQIFSNRHGYALIKVTTATPHGMVTGHHTDQNYQGIDFSGAADSSGGILAPGVYNYIYRIDDTTYFQEVFTAGDTNTAIPAPFNTLLGPMTLSGSPTIGWTGGFASIPVQDAIVMTAEAGMNLFLSFPILADDDFGNQAGIVAAMYWTAGKKIGVALSNERWNNGEQEWFVQTILAAANNALFANSGGAQGYPLDFAISNFSDLGGPPEWGALRTWQLANQVAAGYTGIPEIRVEGYGAGATATATIDPTTHTLTGITLVTGGTGYTSIPTVHVLGGYGTGATATAAIDGSGHVSGFTVTAPGSGYTLTGRSGADVFPLLETSSPDIVVNTHAIGVVVNKFNIPQPITITVVTYTSNLPVQGNYADAMGGGPIGTLFDQLSIADHVDLYTLHNLRGIWYPVTKAHTDYLLGTFGITAHLFGYEGGTAIMCQYGTDTVRKSVRITLDPAMFEAELGINQLFERTYGFASRVIFTYNSVAGLTSDLLWQVFISDTQGVGTGSALENTRPWDLSSVVSQIGGAHRFYATSTGVSTAFASTLGGSTLAAAAAFSDPAAFASTLGGDTLSAHAVYSDPGHFAVTLAGAGLVGSAVTAIGPLRLRSELHTLPLRPDGAGGWTVAAN